MLFGLSRRHFGLTFAASSRQQQQRLGSSIPVILLDGLDNWGNKGDVVSVKRGFARNFLVPRKLAAYATPENKEKFDEVIRAAAAAAVSAPSGSSSGVSGQAKADSILPSLLAQLDEALAANSQLVVTISKPSSAFSAGTGTLYAAVTAAEVSSAVLAQLRIGPIPPQAVAFDGLVKQQGRASVKIGGRLTVNLDVVMAAAEGQAPTPTPTPAP